MPDSEISPAPPGEGEGPATDLLAPDPPVSAAALAALAAAIDLGRKAHPYENVR